jgi:hypothetical protein
MTRVMVCLLIYKWFGVTRIVDAVTKVDVETIGPF